MRRLSYRFIFVFYSVSLFLITGINEYAFAQSGSINFTNYTTDNGISNGLVTCVTQDRQGFMWFGTGDGLDRFDGYEFKVFHHDPFDTSSLTGNSITSLFTDSRGQLWVGTLNGGLNLFDERHERFLHIIINNNNPGKTSDDYIKTICEDKEGDLWLAAPEDGLFEFIFNKNKEKGLYLPEKIIHYASQTRNNNGLKDSLINAIFIDKDDHLWVSENGGTLQVADLKMSDLRFSTPLFTVLQPHVYLKGSEASYNNRQIKELGKGLNSFFIQSFYEDTHHHLWMGSISNLFLLTGRSDTLMSYIIPVLPGTQEGGIYSILKASTNNNLNNTLWLGTWNEGLGIFNPEKLTLQFIQNQPDNNKSLLSGVIWDILEDKSGCIWVSSNGYGVSKYDPHSALFSTPPYFSSERFDKTGPPSIVTFYENKNYLLFGSFNGVFSINKITGIIKKIKLPFLINTMSAADSGKIWMAGMMGLLSFDPHTEKVIWYPHIMRIGELKDQRIIKIYNDHQGGLWLLAVHSFVHFNTKTKTFEDHYFSRETLNANYYPLHGDIYKDNEGNFWLGTEIGLVYFNTKENTFQYYVNNPKDTSSLSFNVVESIVPDPRQPDKYLWIGTAGGGLNKFNFQTKRFVHFTIKDGLPNNTINGILSDDNGNLWISTNNGLSKFNPADNSFHNYDIYDGLTTNEFNPGADYKNENGKFLFGNTKGFNSFYPDSIQSSPYIPPIAFTDFRLFNQPVPIQSKNSPLKQSLSETHDITLPHNENMISFKVAALDYSESNKNQYAYRLTGLSKRWINLGNNRQITLGNLVPGHYTLQVKVSNSDGVWNKKGISMAIHILPPWWKTWWAYLCYFVLLILLVFQVRKRELNRLTLQNNLALESMEASKLKEVDKLKSRFFANISHEFRTPLTLLLGPLNDFSKDHNIKSLTQFVPEMQRNAKRLLQLINQLLDLSKLDASHYTVNTSREDIIPFVKQIVHSFSSMAHRKNIEIETSVDPRLREQLKNEVIHFYFDGDIVEKILTNLLSNAFKFTPAEGNIIVSLNLSEKEKDYLELKVEDTGAGIPFGKLPFIFDRFYQADDSNIRQYEGSGIGLALVKELTELHHGKITAESKTSKGTVITCFLPFDKKVITGSITTTSSAPHEIPLLETEETNNENEISQEGTPIVLVVEDQPDMRKYIRDKLTDNYKIIEARDGKEGLEKAFREIPELIVSDVMMPEMDGFELCKTLKTDDRTCHIPIILLTARAEDHDKMTGLETGADAYLVKPFNAQELLVRVSKLIEVRKRMRKKFSGKLIIKPSEITVTNRDREFMQKLTSLAESHLSDPEFSNEQLCREMNMSISQLRRKLKAVIDQSPQQMIRSLRMQRALELLKKEAGTVSEISWQTGFEDPGYFSKVFKSYFGCLPTEREKFPRK